MLKTLCIIPARGGSKRIPRKNVKPFLGKPIIAYSIEAALKSKLFDEVMVSTDDKEIVKVAKRFGAKVPFIRSESASGDFATTMEVIEEVVTAYGKINRFFRAICCIYPTAPLIEVEHLQRGYALLEDGISDVVYPVVPFSYPVWRGLSLDEQNCAELVWPEHLNTRSQDLKPVFHDAGQWYWMSESAVGEPILKTGSQAIILDESDVQDIDNDSDWAMAELKFRARLLRREE